MACTPTELRKYSALAKKEIGETAVNLAEEVDKLHHLIIETYPDLRLPSDPNSLFERCLRCRKCDRDRAAKQVHTFFQFILDAYKMQNAMYFIPSIHRECYYESMGITLLKQRDSKGRQVVLFSVEKAPLENNSPDTLLAATILVLDELTRFSVDTQRIGVVIVCNLKGFTFGHLQTFSFRRIRAFAKLFRGSFPVRFKGLHCVNVPVMFYHIFAIVKPMLGYKIRNRLHLYSKDWTEFYKDVSPSILPEELGGQLSMLESVDMEFTRQLCKNDEYYEGVYRSGYMLAENKGNNETLTV